MSRTLSLKSRTWGTVAVAAVTSAVLALAATTPAVAEEPAKDVAAAAVADAAPDAVDIVAPESNDAGLVASTDTGDVVLPESASGDVVLTSEQFGTLTMGLPDVVDGAVASVAADGTVVYDGGDEVTLTVQALETAVRATAVIESASAPLEYTYTFDGLTPRLNENGSVTLSVVGDGFTADVAQLDVPWAVDAEGRAVSTQYRIVGSDVIQYVDHRSSTYTYPIVADPTTQHDCGIISCTVRWNRATTRNIRDGGALAGIASGLAALAFWPLAASSAALASMAVFAARYYEVGNCLGIRYAPASIVVASPVWSPVQVGRGTYNCA